MKSEWVSGSGYFPQKKISIRGKNLDRRSGEITEKHPSDLRPTL